MISEMNLQTGVSKQLLGQESGRARARAGIDTFSDAAVQESKQQDSQTSQPGNSSAAAGVETLRGRPNEDTPAALLESMIMQMGGGPYSTYKGMHVSLAV